MIIAATGDYDAPDFNIAAFRDALGKIDEPDILLLAGDMYNFKTPEMYQNIVYILDHLKWKCPVLAVAGNHEFDEDLEKIKSYCGKRILFLDDQTATIKGVGVVGSRGALDVPTFWQSHNMSDISGLYKLKLMKIGSLLQKLDTKVKVLLTHYAPTYKTLKGENVNTFGGMGCKKLEKVLVDTKTTLAIHGHAHYGTAFDFVKGIPVFNVAFPLNKKIVVIDTENLPKTGIHKFVK